MDDFFVIRTEVRNVLESFRAKGKTPSVINSGLCEEFACEVQSRLRAQGAVAEVVYTESFECVEHLGGHAWVQFAGLHFDAEAPEGVTHLTDLPFFQRALAVESPTLDDDISASFDM